MMIMTSRNHILAGTLLLLLNTSAFATSHPPLPDPFSEVIYPTNEMISCETYRPTSDPGRMRNEIYFNNVYGKTQSEVQQHLVTVYWMPKVFGKQYPLKVTSINNVNKQFEKISKELEMLIEIHPEYIKYLEKPTGAFYWRKIENSERTSPHSYGIAMDLNTQYSNYWIWDTGIQKNKLSQEDNIPYINQIPCAIVSIFERNGFIWGGKWLHYDTMHFEYRPELIAVPK
jgi:peptidoglycan L-alanyl-D-glutamate endopeptidase CwlK